MKLRLVVAAKVVPINEHESKFTLALVRQAVKNLGNGTLRVLLMDRGFLDGQDLWVLKAELGIDFVVPSKDKMRVTEDARGLCRQAEDGEGAFKGERAGKKKVDKSGKVKWEGQVSAVGVAGLASYDQYGDEEHAKRANRKDFEGNVLNAVVVTKWQGEEYRVGEEKVFLTHLRFPQDMKLLSEVQGIDICLNGHTHNRLHKPVLVGQLQALLESTGAQIAFLNGWRFGAPIIPGRVTLNDLYNMIPMNPPISTVELTGGEIVAMLEENLERTYARDPYDQMGGYVKRGLGFNAYIKIENPPGQRVQQVFVGNEEVQPGRH